MTPLTMYVAHLQRAASRKKPTGECRHGYEGSPAEDVGQEVRHHQQPLHPVFGWQRGII